MNKKASGIINVIIKRFSLFEICFIISVLFHSGLYGAWFMRNNIIPTLNSSEISFENMDIDFNEVPPELLGGDSDPAPVEVQEWIEGTNKSKKTDESVKEEKDVNAVSGTGTDANGYLYSVKGDRPPRPVFGFDLKKFFPAEARKAGITNRLVIVRVQVDEGGQLISSSVVSQAAGYGFDNAAIEVLNRARFIPGYRNGVPVRMIHDLSVRFLLEN